MCQLALPSELLFLHSTQEYRWEWLGTWAGRGAPRGRIRPSSAPQNRACVPAQCSGVSGSWQLCLPVSQGRAVTPLCPAFPGLRPTQTPCWRLLGDDSVILQLQVAGTWLQEGGVEGSQGPGKGWCVAGETRVPPCSPGWGEGAHPTVAVSPSWALWLQRGQTGTEQGAPGALRAGGA